MFGPLIFPTNQAGYSNPSRNIAGQLGDDEDLESVSCLFCPTEFLFPDEKEICLSHILQEHSLVISDVHMIADLPRYIKFWKDHFDKGDFKQYCTTLLADTKDKITGKVHAKQEFYLLSEAEVIDKELREKLQKEQLETVLEQQRIEREDTNFSRECLFCRQILTPTRSEFLTHLSTQHNLQLGKPSNLVFVDKFITTVEQKLNNLQCIYCEKFFKDRNVLKEHMRKKAHKRVNPNNEMYDKFYIINYTEPGKTWKEREKLNKRKSSQSGSATGGDDDDDDTDSKDDGNWSDWEDDIQQKIVCLFCEQSLPNWTAVLTHMKNDHSFNYEQHSSALDFYEQVKLVNYIRRQIFRNQCITCGGQLSSRDELLTHMTTEKHLNMPDRNLWNQPEFFFPTYENDAFLCEIDDNKRDDEEMADISDVSKTEGQSPVTADFADVDDDSDDDNESDSKVDDNWSDWEDGMEQKIVCLFCDHISPIWASLLAHMKNDHSFNYEDHSSALDFYEQVKLVNYIRRQVLQSHCIICDGQYSSRNELLKHMVAEKHFDMPQRSLWNVQEFYYPTIENDSFLCQIDDNKQDEEEMSDISCALKNQ